MSRSTGGYHLEDGPVLVTGAAGFAGGALMKSLGMGAGDFAADAIEGFSVPDGVKRIRWELPGEPDTDPGEVRYVIHLAALASVADSQRNSGLFNTVNVLGTETVVKWMQRTSPDARLLMVSTSEVYAPSRTPLSERSAEGPLNNYGRTKLEAERIVRDSGLDWVISRSFPHFGPGQKGRFVLPSFCSRIIRAGRNGEQSISVGNLSAVRDYLYIADVVRAYLTLLEKGESGGIYNVCSGEGHSIGEMLEKLLDIAGYDLKAVTENGLLRERDQVLQVGDPRKLQSLKWKRSVSLDEGLNRLFRWWEERT